MASQPTAVCYCARLCAPVGFSRRFRPRDTLCIQLSAVNGFASVAWHLVVGHTTVTRYSPLHLGIGPLIIPKVEV